MQHPIGPRMVRVETRHRLFIWPFRRLSSSRPTRTSWLEGKESASRPICCASPLAGNSENAENNCPHKRPAEHLPQLRRCHPPSRLCGHCSSTQCPLVGAAIAAVVPNRSPCDVMVACRRPLIGRDRPVNVSTLVRVATVTKLGAAQSSSPFGDHTPTAVAGVRDECKVTQPRPGS